MRDLDFVLTQLLQDTAGQERFSGLSSAFFRGADAVILMFDVNQPQTLNALIKWWDDFRDKAPVPDESMEEFCCVIVGNKVDVGNGTGGWAVTESQARDFIHTLVPHPSTSHSPTIDLEAPEAPPVDGEESFLPHPEDESETPKTDSIDIHTYYRRGRALRGSRSHSRSTLFRGGTVGTMTTTHSIYHTPSSSLFDTFESALSSPAFTVLSDSRSSSYSPLREPRRVPSNSSMSSAPTITPSLFIRGQAEAATTTATTPESGSPPSHGYAPPAPPERYPKLFFTSAKTGEGVKDVFEYVARRVVVRQEYEEAIEARTMHVQEANQRTSILLSNYPPERRGGGLCCGS